MVMVALSSNTNMKYFFLQLYFFITSSLGLSQSPTLQQIGVLNEKIDECSGTVLLANNRLAHINDSGNNPVIHITDTTGQLLFSRCVVGAKNRDWEELAYDGEKFLYIGDFGNNRNRRKDLVIYKVDVSNLLKPDSTAVLIGEIRFNYKEQKEFPPSRYQRNFDMEAMILLNDSLYLFSKNRTKPFTGYTYCYRLPTVAGEFTASRVDSFKTGKDVMELFWVTAASFDHKEHKLALLGYNKIWLFSNFEGSHFFKGDSKTFYLDHFTQKEALVFSNSSKLYVTEEVNSRSDGNIYSFNLPVETKKAAEVLLKQQDTISLVNIVNHSFQDTIVSHLICDLPCDIKWEIFTVDGDRVLAGMKEQYAYPEFKIDASSLDNGGYVINLIINDAPHAFKIKKPFLNHQQ